MYYKMMICLCVIMLLGLAPVATGQWQHLGLSAKQPVLGGLYLCRDLLRGAVYDRRRRSKLA